MIDPQSGNQVPPGALPEEVRDDVPINASEGEYILSADIVRYIGLDKIQKMEKQAKEGIAKMEEMGRVGGEPSDAEMPIMPEMPTEEGAMFNVGGLVTKTEDSTFNDRGIPEVFDPRPYLGSQGKGQGGIKKYVGADGRVLYIPINSAGNPVVAIPAGFTDAGEAPTTEEKVQEEEAGTGGAHWADNLTTSQIREEQANRTFRTYDEINPPSQQTGQFPGLLGDLLGGIGDRIKGVMEKLTSGEALGAIGALASTVLLGPLAGPVAARVMGNAIDGYNEKRKAEGLPEMAVEDIIAEAAPQVSLSPAEVTEIANNSQLSPSRYRTVNREELNFPETPDNVQRDATQGGAIDTSKYTVLGVSGKEDDPSFMVRGPDGKIHSGVKPGDDIDGVKFEGIKEGLDTFGITGRPLSEVANLSGTLNETPSSFKPLNDTEGLGRNRVGFTPRVGQASTDMYTPPSSESSSPSRQGLSPNSTGVSFGAGIGQNESSGDSSFQGNTPRSTTGVGRTGTGSDSVAQAFSGSQGSVSVRDTSGQGLSMGTPTSGPQNPGGSVGYSMGETVSSKNDFSGYDRDNPRGFSRGGLVNSPYKDYDIAKGYKKGGLVKRNIK